MFSIFVVLLGRFARSPCSIIVAWQYGKSVGIASLLHLGRYGYSTIAEYVKKFVPSSTTSATCFQLSPFKPSDFKPSGQLLLTGVISATTKL